MVALLSVGFARHGNRPVANTMHLYIDDTSIGCSMFTTIYGHEQDRRCQLLGGRREKVKEEQSLKSEENGFTTVT